MERIYRPKDLGHRLAALQPFLLECELRSWAEVACSTELMLHVADMARRGICRTSLRLGRAGAKSRATKASIQS